MTADEQILELNDLIQVRDNTIAMRDTALASKDDIISERTALILEYEDTLQQLRDQIADLEANGSGNQGSQDNIALEQEVISLFDNTVECLSHFSGQGLPAIMGRVSERLEEIANIWKQKDPYHRNYLFDASYVWPNLGRFGEWLSEYPVWREDSDEVVGYERYVVEGCHEIGTMIAPTVVFEKYEQEGIVQGWFTFIGENGQLPEALQATNGNEYGKYIELAFCYWRGDAQPVCNGAGYDFGETDMHMCLCYPEAFRFMTQSGENLNTDTYNFEIKYYDADCQLLDTTTGLTLENNPKGDNVYFPHSQIDLHKENCKYVVINLSATAISNMCEHSVDYITNDYGYATQFTGTQFLVYDGSGVQSYAKMDDPWYSEYNSRNGYSKPYVGVDDPDFPETCIISPGQAQSPCVMVSSGNKIVMSSGDSMHLANEKYGYKYPKYDFLIDKYDLDVTAAENDDEVKQLILDELDSKVMLPVLKGETTYIEYNPPEKYNSDRGDDWSRKALVSYILTIENVDGQWVTSSSETISDSGTWRSSLDDISRQLDAWEGWEIGNLVNLDATAEENEIVVRPHQVETFRWLTELDEDNYRIKAFRYTHPEDTPTTSSRDEIGGWSGMTFQNTDKYSSDFDPHFVLDTEPYSQTAYTGDGEIEQTRVPFKFEIIVAVKKPDDKTIVCPEQDCFAISNIGYGEFVTSENAWAGGGYDTEYTTSFQDYMPVKAGEEVAYTGDEVRFVTAETIVKHHGQLDSIAELLNVTLTDDKDENEALLAAAIQNIIG